MTRNTLQGDGNNDGKFDNFNINSNVDVIDIYLLGSGTMPSISGVAAAIGSTSIIYTDIVGANTISDQTIAHEMGHCLGLYHTFFGTACDGFTLGGAILSGNRPAGSLCEIDDGPGVAGNGEVAGDYVKDTYADPTWVGVYAGQGDANCRDKDPVYHNFFCNTANNSTISPSTLPWKPYVNNIMDYGHDINCTLQFTQGQAQRMLAAIANDPNVNNAVVKETGIVNIVTTGSLNQCGTSLSSVLLTASGNPNFYFHWSTGLNNIGNITVSPTTTTTYTLTGTSKCMTPATDIVTINVNDGVSFNMAGPTAVCAGSNPQQYTINNNGSLNYSFGTWSVSSPASITNNGVLTIPSSITGGTVTITFTATTTGLGCQVSVSKTVTIVPQSATVSIAASANAICVGQQVTLTAAGTQGLNYLWSNGQTGNTITVSPTATTTYSMVGASPCGTAYNASNNITITVNPLPTVSLQLPSAMCTGNQVNVQYGPTGGVFTSSTSSGATGSLYENVTPPSFFAGNQGNYTIEYSYTNANGCTNTASSTIVIYPNTLAITSSSSSNTLCSGSQLTLSANIGGGTWSSLHPNFADVDPVTGVVTGKAVGTTTISYNVYTCGTLKADYRVINVIQTPTVAQSTNVLSLCSNPFQFAISPASTAGSWLTYGSNVSVTSNGLVTPQSVGAATIIFMPTTITTCLTDPIYIPLDVIPCTATACGSETSTTIHSGTIANGTVYKDGLFFIDGDITINGTVTFQNAQVRIADRFNITVAAGATLNILGSHLYGCGRMWGGIVVGNNGKIKIDEIYSKSSFIEDAVIAVKYSPTTPTQVYANADVLKISNTIFNRNKVSVQIENLVDVTNAPNTNLPISIYNCIFTSRDIPFDPAYLAWDNVEVVKNTTLLASTPYGTTPLSYQSPYINNAIYADNVAEAFLKDGTNTNKPDAGIIIIHTGSSNNGLYKSIQIGKPSTLAYPSANVNTNIFDNLNKGIQSDETNLTVINCTFQNGVGIASGIEANGGCTVNNMITNCTNNYKIAITTVAGTPNNAFFDMNTAITVSNANQVEVANCHIISSQDINNITDKGGNGIVSTNSVFQFINIHNNTISNIRNGIWHNGGMQWGATSFGQLNIDNNTITKEIAIPRATAFVENAINVDAFLFGGSNDAVPVNCRNNTVDKCFNGIELSGWRGKNVNIASNTISLVADAVIAPNTHHYGIKLEGGYGSTNNGLPDLGTVNDNIIYDNQVTGSGMANSNTAIWLSQQSNTNIGCNTVSNAQHGFRFVGTNPQTKFWDNTMKTSNKYGFTLDNNGEIGKQGVWTPTGTTWCSSNNNWEDASLWYNPSNTSLTNYMTNCINSQASNSKLVVLNSSAFRELNPSLSNFSFPFLYNGYYHLGNSTDPILYAPSSGTAANCPRCDGAFQGYYRTTGDLTLLEEIADGTVSILNDDPDERLQVMQQQLYDLLQANPAQLANSNSLQQFMYNNQWSNLDFIHYASKYLADGNIPMVEMILGFWPGQTNLDDNYYQYFDWIVNMYNDPNYLPYASDVLALANRCPLKDGVVVYAVRNLYNAMTNKINSFQDNCEGGQQRSSSGSSKPQFVRLKQPKIKTPEIEIKKNNLVVYPNPAISIVNISYPKMKQLTVTDITGRVVKNTSLNNVSSTQINISGLPKSVYIVKVVDSNNVTATQKLVIQ